MHLALNLFQSVPTQFNIIPLIKNKMELIITANVNSAERYNRAHLRFTFLFVLGDTFLTTNWVALLWILRLGLLILRLGLLFPFSSLLLNCQRRAL